MLLTIVILCQPAPNAPTSSGLPSTPSQPTPSWYAPRYDYRTGMRLVWQEKQSTEGSEEGFKVEQLVLRSTKQGWHIGLIIYPPHGQVHLQLHHFSRQGDYLPLPQQARELTNQHELFPLPRSRLAPGLEWEVRGRIFLDHLRVLPGTARFWIIQRQRHLPSSWQRNIFTNWRETIWIDKQNHIICQRQSCRQKGRQWYRQHSWLKSQETLTPQRLASYRLLFTTVLATRTRLQHKAATASPSCAQLYQQLQKLCYLYQNTPLFTSLQSWRRQLAQWARRAKISLVMPLVYGPEHLLIKRVAVGAIQVDGRAADWHGLPLIIENPSGASCRHTCLTIRQLRLAHDGQRLYLLCQIEPPLEKYWQGHRGCAWIGDLYLNVDDDQLTGSPRLMRGAQVVPGGYEWHIALTIGRLYRNARAYPCPLAHVASWQHQCFRDVTPQPFLIAYQQQHLEVAWPLALLELKPGQKLKVYLRHGGSRRSPTSHTLLNLLLAP